MYYSIHLCLQSEDDGIFYHVPLYFNTTTDWEVAKENFRKACSQMFGSREKYDIEEYPHGHYLSTPLRAIGQTGCLAFGGTNGFGGKTNGPDVYGKFMVELTEFSHKPGFDDNL